jgi:hypothetical protein
MKLPAISSLLTPSQLMAYKSACWLVSSDPKDRGTGRTTVLSAAFLREAMGGRQCELWDHYPYHTGHGRDVMRNQIGFLARKLGLQLEIKNGVVTDILPFGLRDYEFYAGNDEIMSKLAMIDAIKSAFKAGMTKEEILTITEQSIHEETVEFVHTS